ncbi:MAG: 16S rRNA (adenine(1518)-N(6)/adenine(1519)-N(6))-dimethyltransferase RsmA [Rhodospirillaceae bacterium]|jgi:16S rRNA (adenine1518-N6/adenine1519-N6)-dimethyltransferase|nr:16S rRNA (adenine(1518)-N(6)/adenine(1519)-N(6))-dimethyltransferase RsmA [Rhodospirillaceae bacterium]MBT4220407.1 16S rRNA (adenine(1518)-N(6)/adenine(1519)-N(6))-dimethyltransferase RsmA [Rhodospirillaceae bacterium]MBT5012856.1 16S rRNA (adenine(1518)-N(6)/adenine(1519)-N(6))-dimethyltransferase RsmA [Rhodospirillaceae bacterium]MBT5308836.1 16S rRNA (adenine(1518)-N(6)/adenine(1519)-N(6))-dimethyltransferase RsmA [Rhodospirillaceae bacterium]MBT7355136.1 16S rRNA (adenine(1518)-N(6)/ade
MVDLPPLGDLIRRYGLDARKKLGQHFLLDLNLTGRIARAAGELKGYTVVEIGPGPGGLTRALLDAGAENLVAIERDPRCVEALAELSDAYPGRLKIIEADALETDITNLGPAPLKVVANLPYNVATPLLIGWLKQIESINSLTLMFQKEVAERIAAGPGTKTYGRLSVLSQWLCDVHMDFTVAKTAFTPPPKVDSAVVTLTRRTDPLATGGMKSLETVTAAAFGQRRKMLRASLKPLNIDLESLGIDPTARAETLSVEQFCRIAESLKI